MTADLFAKLVPFFDYAPLVEIIGEKAEKGTLFLSGGLMKAEKGTLFLSGGPGHLSPWVHAALAGLVAHGGGWIGQGQE